MQDTVAPYLEQTDLRPTITGRELENMLQKAIDYPLAGVCIPPYWVKKVARDLKTTPLEIITVIGFPLGYQMTQVKVHEVETALKDGATELDVVMNISALKNGVNIWIKGELAQLAQEIHQANALMKVILETAYLSSEEIVTACQICEDAGADFVKTSTGFASKGATLENVQLMRKSVSANVGVKAAGGIRNLTQVQEFIQAGADRIGTSAGFTILAAEDDSKNK